MLSYTFNDIILTTFGVIFFTALWMTYYIHTNVITLPQLNFTDTNTTKLTKTSGNVYNTFKVLFIIWIFLINYIYIGSFNISTIFWDTIQLSNNTFTFFFLSTCVLLSIVVIINLLQKQNMSFNIEYILFVYIIVIGSYLLLSSTNLFITIFFLEFIALLIFGKFTVSKIWFKSNGVQTKNIPYLNQYSYGLFNSLFFQFWANFVSSIFLFFSLLNIHYLCGTSNFYLLNFILYIISLNSYVPELFCTFILTTLISGLFIKLGLSPYQFFKIETYKGIPLFMVIVYTTLYLLIYIYFFIYLLFYQLPTLKIFTGSYMLIIITFSLLYLISILFDTKNFKAFLSYSTLITIINLFITILII